MTELKYKLHDETYHSKLHDATYLAKVRQVNLMGVVVMQRKSFSDMKCSIARSLEEVGEWWSLLIVRECAQGSIRFDEIQAELGIARNILTSRLERLIDLNIIERFPLEDRPKTSGYRLTEKGEDLYPVLITLMQWGDRWLSPGEKPPTILLNEATGTPVEPIKLRDKKGATLLSFRDIRYAPGPGATEITKALIDNRNQRILGHT